MSLLLSAVVLLVCVAVNRKRSRDHEAIQQSLRQFEREEAGKGIDGVCWTWPVGKD